MDNVAATSTRTLHHTPPRPSTRTPYLSPRVNYHDLARVSGLGYTTIRKFLIGDSGLSFRNAKILADAIGCSLDELYAHYVAVGGMKRWRQKGGTPKS